ncbi:ribosomal protein S18-alanine N-acetyltransferase [Oceanisphaera arctica]|uniref:[Ribosomal protein bS18]-alanine N-acetyltransferase n=1 Tax=Oceanisphaera arctica TaxID=641510 RepID=A0A2P5TIJ0_9GAMM|nr:ribosomal protein S18-alanine N-acetyltransferase [Oceanisphaera arctica]PPL14562.1 ribosomal-protein-alanine N-acetyltransferase [Oceanisphaera arctica]GHA05101.1 ribosomal-protein-alanine acetyltransferase [Oceanisphaera arctica]
MQPLFRPLSADDLDTMLLVEQAAHGHPWSRSLLADSFGERYFTGSLWLSGQGFQDKGFSEQASQEQGQLLGYFIADRILDESTLMNICVSPDKQGLGLGRQLMDHYLRLCKQQGLTQLWLEVRESNTSAQALYLSCGYIESGRRRHYYQSASGFEDAILMKR